MKNNSSQQCILISKSKIFFSLFILFFVALQACNAQRSEEKGYKTNQIRDLALIYQGGTHRLEWTEEHFRPFVVHEFADGSKDWLFDGFLFLEFTNGKDRTYASGFAESSARKTEWEWLLDRLFEEEKSLFALDGCIEKAKKEIGAPEFKHKVVLGLPMAHEKQKDWGEMSGKVMDFSKQEEQLEVICWYIDELAARFKEANYKNLDLSGFYWVEEDTIYSKNITVPISKYIHTKLDKEFCWIPYWKARGYEKWRELGFDIAYQQPNHFFDTSIPDTRLDEACESARELNMAMEMEFDKKALYDSENSTYSRFVSYIDYFEKHGVFKESAIAYYSGTDGFFEMSSSENQKDKELMDRLARLIIERRRTMK